MVTQLVKDLTAEEKLTRRLDAMRNCAHGATLRNALTPAMMTIPALDLTFMKEEQRLAGYTTTTHRSS